MSAFGITNNIIRYCITLSYTCSVIHSPRDLEAMTKNLPDTFKKEMDKKMLKRFEYDFHWATHHIMVEVITGLRSVVGHLIKVQCLIQRQYRLYCMCYDHLYTGIYDW